jgi:integrase
MTHLAKAKNGHQLAIHDLTERTREFVAASKSDNTRRSYRSGWNDWTCFCNEGSLPVLPSTPEAVALYITHLATGEYKKSVATIEARIAAISFAHATKGIPSPTQSPIVKATLAGIRRKLSKRQVQKRPLTVKELRSSCEALPRTHAGQRDKLILVLGFASAMRRSELVSLDAEDIRKTEEGLVVTIRRSKTDAAGSGYEIGIPYGSHFATCPVRTYEAWLAASGITTGAVFRRVNKADRILDGRLSDRSVALVLKAALKRIGKDADKYGGHSLRAGLITAAARAGVSERVIALTSRHKSLIVLRRYIRTGSLFSENATASVGL